MKRRDFIAALAATPLVTSCTTRFGVRNAEIVGKDRQHRDGSLLPVRKPFTLAATLLDPALGAVAYVADGKLHNPALVIERGATLDATLINRLAQPTTVHWHGLAVPSAMDGDGSIPVLPNASAHFQFAVNNPSGLYWYHAHPHGLTAEQVYHGLAGLIVIRDDADRKHSALLGVELGKTDLPLMLQDVAICNGMKVPYTNAVNAEASNGQWGNAMAVNGEINATREVTAGWVRLRLCNASNARGLLLAFHSRSAPVTLHILGADGGQLARPVAAQKAFLYPGERIDLALDLRQLSPGDKINAISLAFDARNQLDPASMQTAMGKHTAAQHPWPTLAAAGLCAAAPIAASADGAAMSLFSLAITAGQARAGELPVALGADLARDYGNAPVRQFKLDFAADKGWTINGHQWGDPSPATTHRVARGTTEIWEIHNSPISMPHPMHLHGFSFRVLSRRGLFGPAKALATFADGRMATDLGSKDTVVIWPNEHVRIAVDFSHAFAGEQRYMFHCHNLQHEDQMMMIPVVVA